MLTDFVLRWENMVQHWRGNAGYKIVFTQHLQLYMILIKRFGLGNQTTSFLITPLWLGSLVTLKKLFKTSKEGTPACCHETYGANAEYKCYWTLRNDSKSSIKILERMHNYENRRQVKMVRSFFFFYLLLMSLPWCSTSIIKNRLKDTKQCGASRSLMPAHTARGHLLNRTVYQTEASLHFMNKSGSQHIVLTSLNKAVFLLIDRHSLAVFALPGYHSLRQDLVRFLFLPNPYISNDTIKIEYFRNKVNILFVVIW